MIEISRVGPGVVADPNSVRTTIFFEKGTKTVDLKVHPGGMATLRSLKSNISISGKVLIHASVLEAYQIVNPADDVEYVVASTDGVVTYDAVSKSFTFLVTNLELSYATFTVNGDPFTVEVLVGILNPPEIQYPVNGAENIPLTGVTLVASPFSLSNPVDEDVMVSADWEVSTDPDFVNIVASSYNDTVNLTTFPIP